eukprot:643164-Amphidinium_carterae.1
MARAPVAEHAKTRLLALQQQVDEEQEEAMQQLVRARDSNARSVFSPPEHSTSSIVTALCEELGLTEAAKQDLGVMTLQDFNFVSVADMEAAANRLLTVVERNRLVMALATEGVHLL